MSPSPDAPRLGWLPAAALAGALLALVDVTFTVTAESAASVLAAVGLGVFVGGVIGSVLHGAGAVLARVSSWAVLAGVPIAAAALGLVVAAQLGAFARLNGPYHLLAVGVIIAGVIGGASVGFSAAVMLAPPAAVRARLADTRGRVTVGALLAIVAGALVFADRTYWVGRYPLGHDALGVGALWFLTCCFHVACPPLPATRRTRRGVLAGGVVVSLAALRVLDADDQDALRTRFLERGNRSWMLGVLRTVTDVDRDGFSSLFGGGDCAPLQASVNPGARELAGNGIDDNCVLGDARAFPPRPAVEPIRPTSPSPLNVVLITVDTFRADRMGFERSDLDTTPNLRRWAQHALRFDRAYTAAGLTAVSVPVMMRGIYSRRLLWTQLVDTTNFQLLPLAEAKDIPEDRIRTRFALPLHDPRWPLSRWLQWRGMQTAAVVDDGWITEMFHPRYFASEFETYVDVDALTGASPNDDARTIDAAIEQVARLQQGAKPFFLWVHMFGLHGPNPERPGIPRRTADPDGEYDQAIRYFDQQIARLMTALEPLADRTVIVLTSDHGEHITHNDRFHGVDMLESDLHVPLFVKVPGGRTGVDHSLVSTIDLFPTLLALTATPAPQPLDGVDLTPLIKANQAIPSRILLADTWRINPHGGFFKDFIAAFDGSRKYVFDRRTQTKQLVDQRDRSDTPPNLLDQEPPGALREALLRYLEETENGPVFDER
ncbi:MAG: sulfatase [Kofleriaceae bacterium]|nr:sulfatase [Kofleriaceae bacterium]